MTRGGKPRGQIGKDNDLLDSGGPPHTRHTQKVGPGEFLLSGPVLFLGDGGELRILQYFGMGGVTGALVGKMAAG